MSEETQERVQGPLEEAQQGLGKESLFGVQNLTGWAESSDRGLEIISGV